MASSGEDEYIRGDSRRAKHIAAEQKRREDLSNGFEELCQLIPSCNSADDIGRQRFSKPIVLSKAVEHIEELREEWRAKQTDLEQLKSEQEALNIMLGEVNSLVRSNGVPSADDGNEVTDEEKLRLFDAFTMDMYDSFGDSVNYSSFRDLSASVYAWLERSFVPLVCGLILASLEHKGDLLTRKGRGDAAIHLIAQLKTVATKILPPQDSQLTQSHSQPQ